MNDGPGHVRTATWPAPQRRSIPPISFSFEILVNHDIINLINLNLQVNRWRSILQTFSLLVVFSEVFYCCSSLHFLWHFTSYISSADLAIW